MRWVHLLDIFSLILIRPPLVWQVLTGPRPN